MRLLGRKLAILFGSQILYSFLNQTLKEKFVVYENFTLYTIFIIFIIIITI